MALTAWSRRQSPGARRRPARVAGRIVAAAASMAAARRLINRASNLLSDMEMEMAGGAWAANGEISEIRQHLRPRRKPIAVSDNVRREQIASSQSASAAILTVASALKPRRHRPAAYQKSRIHISCESAIGMLPGRKSRPAWPHFRLSNHQRQS